MKRTLKYFFGGAFAALAAFFLIAASINQINPVPQTWAIANGTNAFTLSSDAVPGVRVAGSNYTGATYSIMGTNGVSYNFKRGFLTSTN
jgi:Na+-transporting NADH:ubiquinone oxidoreductase subunit NqrB